VGLLGASTSAWASLCPIALLLTQTRAAKRIGVAAGLLVLTFIAVPLNIVIPPQLAVEVVEKGLVIAYQGPGLAASYFPTPLEWLVTLFAMAFGFAGLPVWLPHSMAAPTQQSC
jgi:hypothetical protein